MTQRTHVCAYTQSFLLPCAALSSSPWNTTCSAQILPVLTEWQTLQGGRPPPSSLDGLGWPPEGLCDSVSLSRLPPRIRGEPSHPILYSPRGLAPPPPPEASTGLHRVPPHLRSPVIKHTGKHPRRPPPWNPRAQPPSGQQRHPSLAGWGQRRGRGEGDCCWCTLEPREGWRQRRMGARLLPSCLTPCSGEIEREAGRRWARPTIPGLHAVPAGRFPNVGREHAREPEPRASPAKR